MSKRLFLFRHGKSDWDAPFATDRERPLSLRGERDAQNMGMLLAASGTRLPTLVVCSTALRARATLDLALRAGDGWSPEVRYSDALYEATETAVLEEVRSLPQEHDRVMLVGHEPTWSRLVALLCGGGRVRMPTAAMARLDLGVARWQEAAAGGAELVWLFQPAFFRKFRYSDRRR